MLDLHFLIFQSRYAIPWIARGGSESLPDLSDESNTYYRSLDHKARDRTSADAGAKPFSITGHNSSKLSIREE